MRRAAVPLLGLLLAAAPAAPAVDGEATVTLRRDPTAASLAADIAGFAGSRDQGDEAARFARLSRLYLDYTLLETPEKANWRGYPGAYEGWTDFSETAVERRRKAAAVLLAAVRSIDRGRLPAAERISYDLLAERAERGVDLARFPDEALVASGGFSPALSLPFLLGKMPMATREDGERFLARLAAIPRHLEGRQGLLERHAARGIRPPRVLVEAVLPQIDGLLAAPPAKSPLLEPLERLPGSLPEAERRRFRDQGEKLLVNEVAPAFRRYRGFLTERLLPRSRDGVSLAELPDGAAWYAARARLETTTRLSPQEIHDLGLAQVALLRGRMEELKRAAGFAGPLADFFAFLQSDPRFFYTRADDLLAGYRELARRAEAGLPPLFGKLPRLTYRIEPVPDYAASGAPPAFYERGTVAGNPGVFRVNTSKLPTRPKWWMEALALHEGGPGHHLQLSLASELTGVPEWQKLDEYTAFFEGWAVYAESLGERMGFYQDPYSRFGEAASQMWRAVRLVVDTGLHAKGWSRRQAIEYFADNVPLPRQTAEFEIDRYISMPAQALAYKVGELEIRRLRTRAEKELGERFDLRAFHDRVLSRGAVPLDFLAVDVEAWIREEKGKMP